MSAFIRALVATIQIRGVFFDEQGLTVGVDAAVRRLWLERVGDALLGDGQE